MNRPIYPQTQQPVVVKNQYGIQNAWTFENQWQTKLFSCKPMSRCCFACFCLCCMGCKLAKYTGESTAVGCFPCSLNYLRTKLRTARRIKGGCCGDCCASTFCMACTATQLANELEQHGLWEPVKSKSTKTGRP